MGNKASPSEHMVGSVVALRIADEKLRNAEIAKNNLMIENENKQKNLMIENGPTQNTMIEQPMPIELKIYNKLKNGELLTPDESQEYMRIQNMMFPKKSKKIRGRKSYIVEEPLEDEIKNPLANVQSSTMGRGKVINISDTDNIDAISTTSSDYFISSNTDEYIAPQLPPLPPIEESSQEITQEASLEPLNDEAPEENRPVEDIPVEEESKDEESKNENFIDDEEPMIKYTPIGKILKPDLVQIAKDNNIETSKYVLRTKKWIPMNKTELYNVLLNKQLIPQI